MDADPFVAARLLPLAFVERLDWPLQRVPSVLLQSGNVAKKDDVFAEAKGLGKVNFFYENPKKPDRAVCLCVLTKTTPRSNPKSQPQ